MKLWNTAGAGELSCMSFASWLKLSCTLCSLHIHTPLEQIRGVKGSLTEMFIPCVDRVCMYAVNVQVQITERMKPLLMLITASQHQPQSSPAVSDSLLTWFQSSVPPHMVCWHRNHQTCTSLVFVHSNKLLIAVWCLTINLFAWKLMDFLYFTHL